MDEASNDTSTFRFIDLFAGWGIRLGFEAHGGHCVFTSEWNRFAHKKPVSKIFLKTPVIRLLGILHPLMRKIFPIMTFYLLVFHANPLALLEYPKKMRIGRPHGFECTTQGTLFFDVARIIAEKRPKAFLLENVKNLLSHDKGDTFKVIVETLKNELGYEVHYKGHRFFIHKMVVRR